MRLPKRNLLIAAGILFLSAALAAAPGAEEKRTGFDHGRWNRILEEHVSEAGWVDYEGIRDRAGAELRAYLDQLARVRLKDLETRDERIAFWINAYNAICIRTLIDHELPEAVPHAFLFGTNIFTEEKYEVAGKVRSLDDIEHGILRKEFDESRIHAALVCGASSCPRLRPEAYTGEKLDSQLDEECAYWIQKGKTKKGTRKNYLDRSKKTYFASKIFDWYQEDFGGDTDGVLRFVKRYAAEDEREFLEKNPVRVRYLTYDWSLNRQDARKKTAE